MVIEIKEYQEIHFDRLLYIFRLNVPEFFDPAEEGDFRQYLDSYADQYFSIHLDEILVGGAGYKINPRERVASISWIFLHPDYSGRGGGKYAVNHLFGVFSDCNDIVSVRTETSQHGIEFFGSFGFSTIKTAKNYWGKGLDLYRMEMSINDMMNYQLQTNQKQ